MARQSRISHSVRFLRLWRAVRGIPRPQFATIEYLHQQTRAAPTWKGGNVLVLLGPCIATFARQDVGLHSAGNKRYGPALKTSTSTTSPTTSRCRCGSMGAAGPTPWPSTRSTVMTRPCGRTCPRAGASTSCSTTPTRPEEQPVPRLLLQTPQTSSPVGTVRQRRQKVHQS